MLPRAQALVGRKQNEDWCDEHYSDSLSKRAGGISHRACERRHASAWQRLERGHIIAQGSLQLHIHSHGVMLAFAVSRREWAEVAGQVLRLFLAPLGTLTGRTPMGNTGRSDVSAFASMPIPADIAQIVNAGRD